MAGYSSLKTARGALIEYTKASDPLELSFEFNPTTITRSRSIEIPQNNGQGDGGGYDFKDESGVPVAAQGVTVKPESFSLKILLDATERMNSGDTQATDYGVQPELDILRSMVEPKLQVAGGASTLAALGKGDKKQAYASVLLFVWGEQTLPVFMPQVQVEEKAHLPGLVPYRAEATLTLQVIQSENPFYSDELKRMFDSALLASGRQF